MTGIKKLPIAKSPIIGLQYLAYPLCIILNYEECYPWFYSNYIQLQWNKDLVSKFTFYLPCTEKIPEMVFIPWLDVQLMQKATSAANGVDIIRYIISSIDEGYYFYSHFDELFVPKRSSYKKKHFIHDFMITGYDTDKKLFYVLGYSSNAVFETTEIKFEQLEEALFSHVEEEDKAASWLHNTIILLRKTDSCTYGFDLGNVYCSLQDYLLKTDSGKIFSMFEKPKGEHVYGIDVYSYLRKYFNLLIDNKIGYDFRPIHTLYEHKKCMSMRLGYMASNCNIKDIDGIQSAYFNIENTALDARNLQIKYMMDSNPKNLLKIIEKLDEMESLEVQTLEVLLGNIQKAL